MMSHIGGQTIVAGVVGHPITHSLSPLIQNAWLKAAGINGVYVPFSVGVDQIEYFFDGMRGSNIRGLNVTAPFKDAALAVADVKMKRAVRADAANLLIFRPDGKIVADNTDGDGLLAAFAEQVPGFNPVASVVALFGAGGAARGAAAAFLDAGVGQIRVVNRSGDRARTLLHTLGPKVVLRTEQTCLRRANVVINATPLGLGGGAGPTTSFEGLPKSAVVMDMVYRPLETEFLARARAAGHRTVDGLAMLIGQARPSFAALFGQPPPAHVDVRALCLAALERDP
jgi:shikimate dehydrogenase